VFRTLTNWLQEYRFYQPTEENKRKALEALESRGSRHDAATGADVSLKDC